MKLITGNEKRMYVNTALGCNGNCKYCYLPELGATHVKYFSAENVIQEFRKVEFFKKGKNGTVISIGCYSECLDKTNKKQTKDLIAYFLQYNNYIQLATKQAFSYEEFEEIDKKLRYDGQLHIYISLPTYTYAEEIEPYCARPDARISVLKEKARFKNIKIYLYIKPVLRNITICDVGKYKELMKKYDVSCVVGEMLYQNCTTGKQIQVGEDLFYEQDSIESKRIREALTLNGVVYKNSIDTIEHMRKEK